MEFESNSKLNAQEGSALLRELLHVVPIKDLTYNVLKFIALWIVVWYVVYLISGFYVTSISVNNGISFNGIRYRGKRVDLSMDSLRFRLWGNTRKVILDNIRLKIENPEKKGETTKKNTNNAQQKRMSIFSRNPIIRCVERFLLNHKPNIYVDLKDVTVIYPSGDLTEIKYIHLSVASARRKLDQATDVVHMALSLTANRIGHFNEKFSDQEKTPSFVLDVAKFETSLHINYDGDVSKIRLKVFTDELHCSVFRSLQGWLSKAEQSKMNSDNEGSMSESGNAEDSRKRDPFDRLLSFYGYWYPVIEELVVRVENTKIQHIPLMTTDRNITYKELLESGQEHLVHLDVGLKLFSLNAVKLHKESAGYELLFNENDDPLNSNIALQSLTATFFDKDSEGISTVKEKEILYVSNFISTYKSNLIDRISKLRSFRDCNNEIYCTASSPLIDLNTNQVALLIYNGFLLRSYMKLQKLRQTNGARSENLKDNSGSRSPSEEKETEGNTFQEYKPSRNKKKILKFLEEYLPKFDAKIAIEQPRVVIRRRNSSLRDPQALCFSYSSIDFQVSTTSTSTSNEYDIVCRFSNPCLKYMLDVENDSSFRRPKFNNETVFKMTSFQITSKFSNNFTSKFSISAKNSTLNLNHIKVFLGISDLLKEILKTTEHQYRSSLMIMQLTQAISIEKSSFQEYEYGDKRAARKHARGEKRLPQWLSEVTLDITGFSVVLGSRSVLMEKDQMLSIGENSYVDRNHGLRSTRASLKKVSVHIKNKESSQESTSHLVSGKENWSAEVSLHSLEISTKSAFDEKEKFKRFFSLSSLKVIFSVHNYLPIPKFDINVSLDNIDGTYDNFKLFTFLGSIDLIKNAILDPAIQIKKKVASIVKGSDDRDSQGDFSRGTKISDMIKLQFTIGKLDVAAFMHNDFKVKLQLFHVFASIADEQVSFSVDFLRLLSESPHSSSLWARLACIDFINSRFHIERPTYIPINSESIRIIQHHRLLVYKIFDNISITLKVAKELIKNFKSNDKKEMVVKPSASRASRFSDVRLRSKKLLFSAEDDPFECGLAMSFQLGLIEQRKRIKLYEEFDHRATYVRRDSEDIPIDYEKQLYLLQKEMSASWIQIVKTYKKKMSREIFDNRDFLFGYEASLPKIENRDIVAYMIQAPLLNVFMINLDLHLSMPKFPLEEIPQFIHTFGQGVPITSEYSMLAPFHINLGMSEMRMHLRDYPVPLLYVPPKQDKNDRTFFMSGHLVFCEELLRAKEATRVINVPLVPDYNESYYEHYLLTLQKSLSSIKIHTDLGVKFLSNHITRISWSPSYSFGIQQMMLSLDEFSKPPIDPSMKLGFWDKLRFVLHGRCVIDSEVGIEVAFKGSRDPYDIVGTASGFTFALRDKVRWTINEKNDPQSFFDIKAGNVSWNIPDFVGTPLLSWSRDSSKFTFLSHSRKPVLSCFAYFLNPYEEGNIAIELSKAKEVEKQVFSLEKVQFKAGFKLQRRASNNSITNNSKQHYEVRLCNPIYVEKGHDSYAGFRTDFIHMILSLNASGENGYNCLHLTPAVFQQFFNWWTLFSGNMSLPIRRGPLFGAQKNSMKFSQHLFSNTFKFNVKSLFISHAYRDNESGSEDNRLECFGIKAKMSEFLVDLHQRKEPRIEINEGLSKNKEIMKMNFNSGEVHLNRIEIRTMHAFFEEAVSNSEFSKPMYETFDDDNQWFDVSDFEEAFFPSLCGRRTKISIHPLLYSERFSYLRHTNDEVFNRNDIEKVDDQDFGSEFSKETGIQKLQIDMFLSRLNQLQDNIEPSKLEEKDNETLKKRILLVKRKIHENRMQMKMQKDGTIHSTDDDNDNDFHNKFILISMLLKWNHTNRNLIYKYVHFVQLKLNYSKSVSFDAIRSLEKLIQKNRNGLRLTGTRKSFAERNTETKSFTSDRKLSAEYRQSHFDDIIYDIDQGNETVSSDFLVDIKYPQIQLESEESPNSVILVSAPEIDAKIITVFKKSEDESTLSGTELEKRYGVLLHDSNIFVLNKDDLEKSNALISSDFSYGSLTSWPPWVGIEVCMDAQLAGRDKLVVEKSSMTINYKQIRSNLSSDEAMNTEMGNSTGGNETSKASHTLSSILDVDIPKFAVFSTSKQSHTLFSIFSSLLFFSEPMNQDLQDKLNRLKFSINLQDLDILYQKIAESHRLYRLSIFLSKPFEIKKSSLSRKELREFLQINSDKADLNTEMYLMNRSLLLGDSLNADSSTNPVSQWNIRVDQIILHMLEDSRIPILDFAMAHGTFTRVIKEDGSNSNKLGIEMMQGFNFISHAYSPLFLSPIKQKADQHSDKIINIWWDMMRSIGGISVIKNFLIDSQPLHINFDEVTGKKILEYFLLSDDIDFKLSENVKGKSSGTESNKKRTNLEKSSKKESRFSGDPDTSVDDDKTQNLQRNSPKISNKKSKSSLRKQTSFYLQEEHQDDVEDMLVRARKYLSIIDLRINPIRLSISIKLKGYMSLLNVQELTIELPEFVLSNRIMSPLEISASLKKMVIRSLIAHIGKVLRNKMSRKELPESFALSEQLQNYEKFIDIFEKSKEKGKTDNDVNE